MTTVTDSGAGTVIGPLTEPKVTDLSLSSNKLRLMWEWRGVLFTPNNVSVEYIWWIWTFFSRGCQREEIAEALPLKTSRWVLTRPFSQELRLHDDDEEGELEEPGCQQDCYSLFTLSSLKHIFLNLLIFLFLFCSESLTRAKRFVCWLRPGGNNIFHNIALSMHEMCFRLMTPLWIPWGGGGGYLG